MDPKPGQFGLVPISGHIGRGIRVGQQILRRPGCPYQHAFLVLDNEEVIEAMPDGARIASLNQWSESWGPKAFSNLTLTDSEVERVIVVGRKLVGTPYSFLDYAALGLARVGIRPPGLEQYIANTGHMICSQLVDEAYKRAGIHLYADGRLSQNVIPADLYFDFIDVK